MKLYCLSGHPNKPCYVLRFKEITLMLDCGLITQTVLSFMPLSLVPSARLNNLLNWTPHNCTDPRLEGELKECCGRIFVNSAPEFCPPLQKLVDYSEINAILISNYTAMFALPLITEGTDFQGIVYMTEPTLQVGRFYLEELVKYIEQTPKPTLASHWKDMLHLLPPPFSDSLKPRSWQQIFSWESVLSSLAKVQTIGYDEKVDIYGTLKITPISSGYCLGSSNWIIMSDYEKIVYVSGSSTLTTHPRPIDQTSLKNADVLILTGLTQTPVANPDTMLGELCMTAAMTLRNNGSVLIPCYPSGVVYDLFECLSTHLDSSGLSHIPMYFISPVSDVSLGYSNIFAEWLSQGKQNKIYLPEEPFPHAHLVKTGRLKPFKHIYDDGFCNDMRQPCVVFCGHPSLRFGDSVHFIELWGSNPLHTVIFTEPDYPYLEALAPFQPVAMKAVHCAIDTSLNFTQANKLIRELKPSTLILPECYTQPPVTHPNRTELVIEQPPERKVLTINRGEVLTLPLKRRKLVVDLAADMAEKLLPSEIKSNVGLVTITGELKVKDNKLKIELLKSRDCESVSCKKMAIDSVENLRNCKYTWGTLNIDKFVKKLDEEGIRDVKIEPSASGSIIHLQDEDTLIQIDDDSTHICCASLEKGFRIKLRNILLDCLNQF